MDVILEQAVHVLSVSRTDFGCSTAQLVSLNGRKVALVALTWIVA